MKPLSFRFTFLVFLVLFLSACSPHPVSGVWKATEANALGIDRLVVGFEGRAEFTTSDQGSVTWHCFWGISDKKTLALDCTPSSNPDNKKSFTLSVNDNDKAELRDESTLLATFNRLDENPSPKK